MKKKKKKMMVVCALGLALLIVCLAQCIKTTHHANSTHTQGYRHQKIALAASTVKVGAYDVIASEMVKVALVITPIFYIIYTVALAFVAGYFIESHHDSALQIAEWLAPLILFIGLLPYSYCSTKFGDQITFSWKKILLYIRKTVHNKKYNALKEKRKVIQAKVRAFSRQYLTEGGTFKEKTVTGTLKQTYQNLRRADHRFSMTPKDADIIKNNQDTMQHMGTIDSSDRESSGNENRDSDSDGGGEKRVNQDNGAKVFPAAEEAN